MKPKRPPLALKADAFAAHAIPQPDPVRVATSTPAAVPPQSVPDDPVAPKAIRLTEERGGANEPSKEARQPSRAGKVQVVAWVAEGRRAELKIVAAKLRRTVDDLLTSMIDELVAKNLGS